MINFNLIMLQNNSLENILLESIGDFENRIKAQTIDIEEYINTNEIRTYNHIYLLEQNKALINDIKVFSVIFKSESPSYCLAIVRIALDRVTKLSFLSTKNLEEQRNICTKDLLQFYKIYYKNSDSQEDKKLYKQEFEKELHGYNYSLDDDKRIEGFINFAERIKSGNSVLNITELYFAYQITSEFIHGNLGQLLYRPKENRFSLQLMLIVLLNMVKLNDWHLNDKIVSDKTTQIINKYRHLGNAE